MRYQDFYQFMLLFFAFLVVFGIGVFVYKELFPEYKTYQYVYEDLEKFRASYTGEKPAPFATGIKQILIPDEKNGPEIIDRCISCHVALDLPHFSPVRVALDVNAQPSYDAEGKPVLESNPDYIWAQLDQTIQETTNVAEAESLVALQKRVIGGREVDMTKVLQMHPLIGSEIRPFQYHSMEEYGCTSCHSGNGRALVAKRAHGPVYDGEYEPAYTTVKPEFTERDEKNDPPFARMYNDKPGHGLAFQTTPILAGDLIVAKCVNCHQSASKEVQGSIDKLSYFSDQKKQQIERIEEGVENDQKALATLLVLQKSIQEKGKEETIAWLKEELGNYHNSSAEIDAYEGQLTYLKQHQDVLAAIEEDITRIRASENGKQRALEKEQAVLKQFESSSEPLKIANQDTALVTKMGTEVDRLIVNYNRGKELFISQACYACHRIAGFSRASVGPELTRAGLSYPWFIKESIVWPQADLPSSTMPNFRLDHQELSDLMTFLLAQTGDTKAVSEVDYHISLKEWEAGEKMPWEKPVSPTALHDVRQGMNVFVTEGCAACHKLEGFESTVGFAQGHTIEEREWFYRLIPEQIPGSKLAQVVVVQAEEIDRHIVDGVRKEGIIEEIEAAHPGLVEGFYTNFKYAARAIDPADQERLHRVLMMYIQVYGMGRDIAPHLNWSGVYRDDAWLLGHFQNPSAYTARSIMPVMPFDDTKFYMLNTMLHVLGRKNRDTLQEIWRDQGFNPPLAYDLLCSSCHGVNRQGNGLISEWIYPIPKNLRNPVFLRNLTKERAIDSIMHGVKGTPMPPWGESVSLEDPDPVLTRSQATQLVDWLYQGLPDERRSETKEDFEKWSYSPEGVVQEMEKQRDLLAPIPSNVDVEAYFEARPNPVPGPDKELYYIREKYYTDHNLEEAEKYFIVNCATCHGKEGGGTGLRSTSMVEAKPRMLTNLPWLRTRDDLRLIRSIKYGVPGTSMIPWGDQTTSAQRMQLVMFIRELTRAQMLGDELEAVLYDVFDEKIQAVEESRAAEYAQLEKNQKELREAKQRLYEDLELTPGLPELNKAVEKGEALDALYVELIQKIREEREIFDTLGRQVIAAKLSEPLVRDFFNVIRSDKTAFERVISALDQEIAAYQARIDREEGDIRSPERGKTIQNLMDEQATYINLRTKLIVQLADVQKLQTTQQSIYARLPSHNP